MLSSVNCATAISSNGSGPQHTSSLTGGNGSKMIRARNCSGGKFTVELTDGRIAFHTSPSVKNWPRARQTAAAIADAGMSPAAFVAAYLDWRAATKAAMSCCFSSQVFPSA